MNYWIGIEEPPTIAISLRFGFDGLSHFPAEIFQRLAHGRNQSLVAVTLHGGGESRLFRDNLFCLHPLFVYEDIIAD